MVEEAAVICGHKSVEGIRRKCQVSNEYDPVARHLVSPVDRCKEREDELNRIVAVATIEASTILETDDAKDVHDVIASRFVDWEQSGEPPPHP